LGCSVVSLGDGIRALVWLKRPVVKGFLDTLATIGFLGLLSGLALAFYLPQISPIEPSLATAQTVPYESHGTRYFIRPLEVLGLNVGLAGAWSLCMIAMALRAAIFGIESEKAGWLSLLVHIVLGGAGVIVLAQFLIGGGNWPFEGLVR
jgi:hypothetical protein